MTPANFGKAACAALGVGCLAWMATKSIPAWPGTSTPTEPIPRLLGNGFSLEDCLENRPREVAFAPYLSSVPVQLLQRLPTVKHSRNFQSKYEKFLEERDCFAHPPNEELFVSGNIVAAETLNTLRGDGDARYLALDSALALARSRNAYGIAIVAETHETRSARIVENWLGTESLTTGNIFLYELPSQSNDGALGFNENGISEHKTSPRPATIFSLENVLTRAKTNAMAMVVALDSGERNSDHFFSYAEAFCNDALTKRTLAAPLSVLARDATTHRLPHAFLARTLLRMSETEAEGDFYESVDDCTDHIALSTKGELRGYLANFVKLSTSVQPKSATRTYVEKYLASTTSADGEAALSLVMVLYRDESFARAIVWARKAFPNRNITAQMGFDHAKRVSLLADYMLRKSP